MLTKILLGVIAVLCLVIGVFSFILNNKKKKEELLKTEKEELEKSLKETQEKEKTENSINENYVKEKQKNEKSLQDSNAPDLTGFNAGVELLQKLRDKR